MMMKYSEQSYAGSLSTSGETEDVLGGESKISLTPLWEYVIRSQCLPESLDLDLLFHTIGERLRDPEWEVRQHAMRVLVDFIPLIHTEILDAKIAIVLEDLVTNLGHLGPAVRKGAVDSLRAYVNHSQKTDDIIVNLVERGIEHAKENMVHTNVVLGIILSLPFLINNRLHDETVVYIIHRLLDKIVKVVHQETVLRALLRIREIVGYDKFDYALITHETYNSRKEFELLCEVYDLPIFRSIRNTSEDTTDSQTNVPINEDSSSENVEASAISSEEASRELSSSSEDKACDGMGILKDNVVTYAKTEDVIEEVPDFNYTEDKVILETEIQLESGPSITMKIHEENSHDCMGGNEDRSKTFKVLPDVSDELDDYEHLRRTPRRVHFGGEIVKLRTPDSDSNNLSDGDDATISIISDGKNNNPLIEIKYIENETKLTTRTSRSLIPIPVKHTQSAPSSPYRTNLYKARIFKSSPNLSKSKRFQPKVSKSRIPRRFNTEVKKSVETKIQIKISENTSKMSGKKSSPKKTITKIRHMQNLQHTDVLKPEDVKVEVKKSQDAKRYLDNLKHEEILTPKSQERPVKSQKHMANMRHQKLIRSQDSEVKQIETEETKIEERKSEEKKLAPKTAKSADFFPPIVTSRRNSREDEFSPVPIHNEIEVLYNLTRSPSPRRGSDIKLPETKHAQDETTASEIIPKPTPKDAPDAKEPSDSSSDTKPQDFASFQIYNSSLSDGFYEFTDSPIPIKDSGDCLTCSSSGSDSAAAEKARADNFGILDNRIVADLQNNDDVRARQRGLEELLRVIQTPSVLESLRDRLPSLLYILFSAEQQPILQPIAEQTLSILFTSMEEQCLISRLHQISLNLSKMGSPLGVRLAILLMRRVPPRLLVDQLLADPILGAKSTKVREGALQILMTVSRIFPSTDLNIPKSVKSVVTTLRDRKRKVRQAALETLAALAQLSSPGLVLDVATELTEEWNDKEQILRVIRTRLSRKQLPAVNMNGNIRYSTPTGDSEIEWLSRGSGSQSPQLTRSTLTTTEDEFEPAGLAKRQRFFSARTETVSSGNSFETRFISSDEARREPAILGGSFTEGKLPRRFVNEAFEDDRFVDKKEELRLAKENLSRFAVKDGDKARRRFVEITNLEGEGSRFPPVGGVASGDGGEARFVVLDGVENAESGRKISYWRSRRMIVEEKSEEITSDWSKSSREEPSSRAPTTQIWAIDPSAFNASEKLSTANGTLRQVYVVKTNDSKTASTNTAVHDYKEGATNTSPVFRKQQRGRSFSPPSRKSDYDSYDEQTDFESRRFVNVQRHKREVQRIRREERVRKSFSSEHISSVERLRKENVGSSGSSSGSSIRQTGNWHRDLRSGIPVPIFPDSKLRIRNRSNNYKPKGPMSIPYYHPTVKSPSAHTTPEKFTIPEQPHIIGRQPFSSGSESSGYFTPPPDPNTVDPTPEVTPEPSPPSDRRTPTAIPERFIQLDTPKQSVENFTIIDSDVETPEDDEEPQKEAPAPAPSPIKPRVIERKNTSNSLDEFNLKETEAFAEQRIKSTPNSLDETDFTQITFSEKRALSKSEVDIKISTHITRKNVNSAPALNEIITDFQTYEEEPAAAKTSLPGSVADSLDDTEAPEELFQNSPTKKTPEKSATTTKSSVRRKCRVANTNLTLYPDNLRPFTKPKEALNEVAGQLESNEWEVTMKGLQGMVRLIRHHKETIEANMHAVCVLLGKHIRNLRSQVARAACLAAIELFGISKRPLELELDELAGPLLHRTADTNKFLRSDANAALDEMSANLSIPRVISAVTFRGCQHQNAVVRCAAARLLCNIVHRLGAEKVFQLPRDTRDRILLSGANLLTEGSLETRKHSKMMLGELASHCQFQRAMTEAVPSSILRHIDKTLRVLMK